MLSWKSDGEFVSYLVFSHIPQSTTDDLIILRRVIVDDINEEQILLLEIKVYSKWKQAGGLHEGL